MKEYYHYSSSVKNSPEKLLFSNLFINKLIKISKFAIQQLNRYIQIKDCNTNEELLFGVPFQQQKKCQNLIRNLALFYSKLLTLFNLDIIKSLIVDFVELVNF